jgi:pimeloyl-ACP methyl ester carboxylesterase
MATTPVFSPNHHIAESSASDDSPATASVSMAIGPLVLLHGDRSRATWQPVLDGSTALIRRIVTLDLPGHGESRRLPTTARSPWSG